MLLTCVSTISVDKKCTQFFYCKYMGLVSPGNKPLPKLTLTKFNDTICYYVTGPQCVNHCSSRRLFKSSHIKHIKITSPNAVCVVPVRTLIFSLNIPSTLIYIYTFCELYHSCFIIHPLWTVIHQRISFKVACLREEASRTTHTGIRLQISFL